MSQWFNEHRKAIGAGVSAGLVAFLGVMADGITAQEWSAVIGAFLLPFGVTWVLPNAPPHATQLPAKSPPVGA